jgi:DNA-binding response OmpR family regulator
MTANRYPPGHDYCQRPLVLIVDDTPMNIQLLAQVLDQDYELAIATTGEQALTMINDTPPAIVLLDVNMPSMDGYEVCRALKRNILTAAIPVIFLTARTETADIVQGFDAGAVDYVLKPFNCTELKARVRTHIELHQLKSFLPVCSYCSKVRDDDKWHEITAYISRKTHTAFSHGICPACYQKHCEEMDKG